MATLSETEKVADPSADQVLEALPALRRWLVRSGAARDNREGRRSSSLSDVRALIHLYQRGPMPMGELARGLGISCSTATECVAGLEARGRVMKDRPESDRRQVVVSLTPEAKASAAQVVSQRKIVIERVLQQLLPREAKAFVKGLDYLAAEVDAWMDLTPSDAKNGLPVVGEPARA